MAGANGLGLFPELGQDVRSYGRGVLPYEAIKLLVDTGRITSDDDIDESQIQPASLDLRLGAEAFQVRASFLPGKGEQVRAAIQELEVQRLDLTGGAVLQKGCVYIVPLQESLRLGKNTLGKANPKSTTGRLDVFARLITEHADRFDEVPRDYCGPLFVEVAPKTFNVLVRKGTRINQLRFLRGLPSHSDASRKAVSGADDLVFDEHGEPMKATVLSGLWFSVDLKGPRETDVIGWKARRDAPVVDVEKFDYYDPAQFWEPIGRPADRRLILTPGDFYILGSKERVRIPPAYAAEMVPYDPAMGEFRVHYAGFFDPGFGYGEAGEIRGTRAILEVRSHEVPYALRDGQHVGRLIYERLVTSPGKVYGRDVGSSYAHQQLGLSKQFRQPVR